MLIGTLIMMISVSVSLNRNEINEWVVKPNVVQAVIDSARLIGLPSSKAARAYAIKIQAPDPTTEQIVYVSEPLSSRKLFFRNYFQESI